METRTASGGSPWRWRIRALYLFERMRKAPPASLLQTRYYGVTPYRLGPDQIVSGTIKRMDKGDAIIESRTG